MTKAINRRLFSLFRLSMIEVYVKERDDIETKTCVDNLIANNRNYMPGSYQHEMMEMYK